MNKNHKMQTQNIMQTHNTNILYMQSHFINQKSASDFEIQFSHIGYSKLKLL